MTFSVGVWSSIQMASPSADINYIMEVVRRDCVLVCLNDDINPVDVDVEELVHEQLDAHIDDMSLDRKKELIQMDGTSLAELIASIESRPNREFDESLISLSHEELYSALLWELFIVKYDLVEYVRAHEFFTNSDDETDDETDEIHDKLDLAVHTKRMDEWESSIEDWMLYVPERDTTFSRYMWDVVRIQPERDDDADTDTEDA